MSSVMHPSEMTCAVEQSMPKNDAGLPELNEAYARLTRELPRSFGNTLRWLHDPKARIVRIPVGIVLIGLSFFWFLPVIGIELLPLGLLLIAFDVPFLRRPLARSVIWCVELWVSLRRWWGHH